jgi:hypothetical protein
MKFSWHQSQPIESQRKAGNRVSSEKTLNEVFSRLSSVRRYEVWFIRLALVDGSGAWWFRYLLTNPGGRGDVHTAQQMPVQVWATWFPLHERPYTLIEGFPTADLDLSARAQAPFHFCIRENGINENSCHGALEGNGHKVSWRLQYRSTFRCTLSNKGWIGFSRTPHSNAMFSGRITLDGRTIEGNPLGYGLQGHNCGYKHRGFWVWTHAFFARPQGAASTLEALIYDMPLGLMFRKAVLWHDGRSYVFRNLKEIARDPDKLHWQFRGATRDGEQLDFCASGEGISVHQLPYQKTDGRGSFQVRNNSLAQARFCLTRPNAVGEALETASGAVLEMGGNVPGLVQ